MKPNPFEESKPNPFADTPTKPNPFVNTQEKPNPFETHPLAKRIKSFFTQEAATPKDWKDVPRWIGESAAKFGYNQAEFMAKWGNPLNWTPENLEKDLKGMAMGTIKPAALDAIYYEMKGDMPKAQQAFEETKQGWLHDPVGSFAGLLPLITPFAKGVLGKTPTTNFWKAVEHEPIPETKVPIHEMPEEHIDIFNKWADMEDRIGAIDIRLNDLRRQHESALGAEIEVGGRRGMAESMQGRKGGYQKGEATKLIKRYGTPETFESQIKTLENERQSIINEAKQDIGTFKTNVIRKEEPKSDPFVEAPKVPSISTEESKYEQLISRYMKKDFLEQQGQHILDTMEDQNISPKTVSKKFWETTYFKLPGEVQTKFQQYLTALTGWKPGAPMGWDKTGKVMIAKDWFDIAKNVGVGNSVTNLEGTERGYVALMHDANERFIERPRTAEPVAKELPQSAPKVPTTSTVGPKEYIPKYAGSINLERMDIPEEGKKMMVERAEKMKKPPVHHLEDVKAQAEALHWTADDVLNLKKHQQVTDKEITAVRKVNADTMFGFLKKVNENAPDKDEAFSRMLKVWQTNQSLSRQASQVLGAHRIEVKGEDPIIAYRLKVIDELMKKKGTDDQVFLENAIKDISAMNDPAQMHKFLYNITTSPATKVANMIREAVINGIISAAKTIFKVHLSQGLMTLSRPIIETPAAATYSAIESFITGKPREVLFGESVKDLQGLIQGLPTGAKYMLKSIRQERQVFSQDVAGRPRFFDPAIPNPKYFPIGRVIRTPGNLIGGPDDGIGAWNYHAVRFTEAWSQATREGLEGKELDDRVQDLMENDERIREVATRDQFERRFQRPLSKPMRTIQRLREDTKVGWVLAPFLTIIDSYIRTGYERSPFIFPELRKAGELTQRERSFKIAKAVTGTLLGAAVVKYAMEGHITGAAPKDPLKRKALYELGWRPFHYTLDKKHYHSYLWAEAVAPIVGFAATMVQHYPGLDKEDAATKVGHAFGATVLDKTFAYGLSMLFDAIEDPDRHAKRFQISLAGEAVPNILLRAARYVDPTIRKPETMTEEMMSKIPYFSQHVRPLRGLWGEPVQETGSPWERFLSPFSSSTISDDPTTNEVVRLGINIGTPLDKIGHIPMTDKEYELFQSVSGSVAHKKITELIHSNNVYPYGKPYKELPDYIKEKVIKRENEKVREHYKKEILEHYVKFRYAKHGVSQQKFDWMEKGALPIPKELQE